MSSSVEARIAADAPGRIPWPDERRECRDIARAFKQILKLIPEQQRAVLLLRYGYFGEPWTLKQIAALRQCSKERVRQLQCEATKRFRLYRAPLLLALSGECDPGVLVRFEIAQVLQRREAARLAREAERRRRQMTIAEFLLRDLKERRQ